MLLANFETSFQFLTFLDFEFQIFYYISMWWILRTFLSISYFLKF